MLVLTRKAGQSIELDLENNLELERPQNGDASGSIEVHVMQVDGSEVKLGISARRRSEKVSDTPVK